jgi:predicted NBD/HSP70 family sugar kinase
MDLPAVGRDRHAQVRRLIDEMESAQPIAEGQFNALGMLVTDASLAADEPALEAAQEGLQLLYSQHAVLSNPDEEHVEQRGRLLGMIDVTHWALRRLPSALQVGLDPSSHAGRFLTAVAARPGLSNQELAERLGIDETEASRVGRRLLAAGVVWRRKEWRRNAWDITPRGRSCLLSAGLASSDAEAPELEVAVGIKMLPDRLVGTVVDTNAEPLACASRVLGSATEPAQQADELAAFARKLVPGGYASDRVGLGVELGGHVSVHNGKVVLGPTRAWDDFPLHETLQEATGLPAVIENDANAIAEYEYVFGADKGSHPLAVILLDEVIGCGLVTHGRIIHGTNGMAGGIGHVIVQPDGRECRCGCGKKGCLDSVASTLAIPQIFAERAGLPDPEAPDLPDVARYFDKGDEDAVAAIEEAGSALGLAISAVLDLINPEKLVLYGPAELVGESRHPAAERFMKHVRESSERHASSAAYGDCTLVAKVYDDEIGARAAAAVALLRAKDRPHDL